MSHVDAKQSENASPEDRIVAEVRSIAERGIVASVEDHFAGYFNELNVTVNLQPEAQDPEVIRLRNELLAHLEKRFALSPIGFTWQVSFWRSLSCVEVLYPGDSVLSESATLQRQQGGSNGA
jgi:hypothetical protein